MVNIEISKREKLLKFSNEKKNKQCIGNCNKIIKLKMTSSKQILANIYKEHPIRIVIGTVAN